MTQDEGDMRPFRPRWPLLVDEDTKRDLLEQLAEMVHTPRPAGPEGAFARGYETGMATVMLTLGINEAASPERRSLPAPADQGTLPPDPLVVPWRVGRKLGRTVYAETSDDPEDHILLGMLDSRELAEHIVELHNARK